MRKNPYKPATIAVLDERIVMADLARKIYAACEGANENVVSSTFVNILTDLAVRNGVTRDQFLSDLGFVYDEQKKRLS